MKIKTTGLVFVLAIASVGCVSSGGPPTPRPASDSEAAEANLQLGIGYLTQGRPDAALDALERALALDPRRAEIHYTAAVAYDQSNEMELAETHYRRATQLDSSNGDSLNAFAVFLCRQGRWDDAQPVFDRAIATPRFQNAQTATINAATCARSDGDLVAAERYFRSALTANPAHADALGGMLELSYQSEDYLQGRAFMQRLMAAAEPNSSQLLLCYLIETELNDNRAAGDCATRLRSQYPNSAELRRLQELQRDGG
jgi:type IV pilus assembly protein PilF